LDFLSPLSGETFPAGAWTYAVQDVLGSVRIEAGAANIISATQTYAPFGSPLSTHGTFAGSFGFTGEQVDSSGQVYLRARYYTPSLGVFPSLDPFEGTTRRPMSLNGYAWVEGNAPNWVDPSGMCPELRRVNDNSTQRTNESNHYHEAVELCYEMRNTLKRWGVNVVWDTTAVDPYWARLNCLPEQVVEACNPERGQRWTTNEMRAIFNAFRIFEGAHQRLGMGSVYPWPLANPVTYRKRDYVGSSSADYTALGKHEYNTRTVTMSALNWGEFEGADYEVNAQIRAWLVLHEFSHILVKDRTPAGVGYEFYATEQLPEEIVANFGRITPTAYATVSNYERATEVVTATFWNNGYSAVNNFDSGAGGRTAQFLQTVEDSYGTLTVPLTNVRDVVVQGQTLETWVIANVILRNP
jgi:RHS repeat-associated protein